MPSPLKSAVPAMLQVVEITPKSLDEAMLPPFMYQITVSPLAVLCQRMSVLPSPL